MQLTINDLDWWTHLFDEDEAHDFELQVRKPNNSGAGNGNTSSSEPSEIGGLRVEHIELVDPATNSSINRVYQYGSGYVNTDPEYQRIAKIKSNGNITTYFKRTSSPIIATSKTKGGVVGYNKVTVKEIGNGYTEHYYYSPNEHQDKIFSSPFIGLDGAVMEKGDILPATEDDWNYPYALKDEKDWKRGLLKEQITYKEDGSPIKKIENKYHFYDDILHPSYNPLKIRTISGIRVGSGEFGTTNFSNLINFYQLQSAYYDIDEVIETNYFKDGQELTTTTKYEYSPNQRTVKSTSVTNSKNEIIETTNLFPKDINSSIADLLVLKNLINKPLEIKQETNGVSTSEVHNIFEENNGNITLAQVEMFTKAGQNHTL